MLHTVQAIFQERRNTSEATDPFDKIRIQALRNLEKQGLPTPKEEAYKHTPVADWFVTHFNTHNQTLPPIQTEQQTKASMRYAHLDAYHIVLYNGQTYDVSNDYDGRNPLIQVTTFQEAYKQQLPAFLAHCAQYARSDMDAFVALNTALFEEGLFIHIADRAIVDKPLVIHHCTLDGSTKTITYPRLLVAAGTHSQASIINAWYTKGLTNAVAEVIVQEHAQLDYYTLQTDLDVAHCQVNTTQCYQMAHSTLKAYTLTWSGAMVRNNVYHTMNDPHSTTNLYGLYCLRAQQHVDNSTHVSHHQPHTYSNELYKGILMEEATGVFHGSIYVGPEAQQTNALQHNKNLLLSNQTTLHTQPQLQIWANDVKCTHGATVGQIDEAQLFYLQTRGLSKSAAYNLLKQAFASEILGKIPLQALRKQLYDSLAKQNVNA